MKRLHVNVGVTNLESSVRFYSSLFDAEPTVLKDDYAKWMLDDPRVNFSITSRGTRKGIDHLGLQVGTSEELAEALARLRGAGAPLADQGKTTCCYAHSEKGWSRDPDGVAWEAFLTTGESAEYGNGDTAATEGSGACCDRPTLEGKASGCCADPVPPATRAA